MDKYAGIDVFLEVSHVCVVDSQGKILKGARVASEPDALIDWFASYGAPMARIGLEADFQSPAERFSKCVASTG